ncbi:DUF1754-domain-containing protein [Tilletiaria anomala UBC 951]|uniref:DUF1754-domain-containing protein n=1 Tax=Tilletiaria anomala (strain ATCC 24038 / CBS 436.72 / UBC 951) TaxID=1037660 RepID=A0A066VWV7_TILAU|nr:DUF1754-domain-containing protein [Tilletiaria anomala UBC 951]KDN45956.1 DUF1754-domain-containing protein [Tilletiaria anomala UBC 951]
MPADDLYAVPSGGSLKFKGSPSKKKKKSKSSTSKSAREGPWKTSSATLKSKGKQAANDEDANEVDLEPVDEQDHGSSSSWPTMTEAERRFEEIQRKRMADKVSKEARKSHKERVDQFNGHLASLTEHFDLPKVGPG